MTHLNTYWRQHGNRSHSPSSSGHQLRQGTYRSASAEALGASSHSLLPSVSAADCRGLRWCREQSLARPYPLEKCKKNAPESCLNALTCERYSSRLHQDVSNSSTLEKGDYGQARLYHQRNRGAAEAEQGLSLQTLANAEARRLSRWQCLENSGALFTEVLQRWRW